MLNWQNGISSNIFPGSGWRILINFTESTGNLDQYTTWTDRNPYNATDIKLVKDASWFNPLDSQRIPRVLIEFRYPNIQMNCTIKFLAGANLSNNAYMKLVTI